MSEKYFAKEKSSLTHKNEIIKNSKEKVENNSLFGSNESNNENNISKIKNLRDKKFNLPKNSVDSNEQNLHKFFN